jgi:DNA repair exonuclease SbcCD ATPase subunit
MAKRILLHRLVLHNFKGIRDFTMDTDDGNVRVYGDNAVGKTTLFDAFTFLLFDKDSQNKKDFQIKTLDKDGKVLHGLEHEVEGVLAVDSKQVTLRKVFSEKWTKKRGAATAEFTGHTTDYYIDGVPVKKGEYTNRVDEIVSEEAFKLLTSPKFFNEQLHWQKRREILLQVCGDVSDTEVIANNNELSKLPSILGERSIEDHRKVIASKRAEINKELEKIPVRIDEVDRSKPELPDEGERFFENSIGEMRGIIAEKEAELYRIQSGGEKSVKEKRIREIEGELLQIKNQLQADTLDKVEAKRQEVLAIKSDYSDLQRKVSDIRWHIDQNAKIIGDRQSEASKLRKQWHEVNIEIFPLHNDTNCPTCGQAMPEEQVQAAHEKAFANFNRHKAERLEEITAKGKLTAKEAKHLEKENDEHRKEIEKFGNHLSSKEKELRALEVELSNLQASVKEVETDPKYINKVKESAIIQQEINQLRVSVQESIAKVREDIAGLRSEVDALEQEKVKFHQVRLAEQRIDQLKQQEKELAAEFERLEHELFMTEEFIRTKVSLLEEKINSKFKYARFKLFDQQINGGLTEVCETIFNGVPYSTGLNNAAMINVGLDIINTLSIHYGFTAPIFIDNAEAVTKFIETNGQIISLVVSEKDKLLRVDKIKQSIQEAV